MNQTVFVLAVVFAGLAAPVSLMSDASLPYEKAPFENLVVSGQPSLEQLESVSSAGYTTVINLRRAGEFDDFDEAAEVTRLGMAYVHIPVKDVESITPADAQALHEAITGATGPVLLHCTIGWRAGGLLAIERYLLHGASEAQASEIAAAAHMDHLRGDVKDWIDAQQ